MWGETLSPAVRRERSAFAIAENVIGKCAA
jgi:hypothetical protein